MSFFTLNSFCFKSRLLIIVISEMIMFKGRIIVLISANSIIPFLINIYNIDNSIIKQNINNIQVISIMVQKDFRLFIDIIFK